jgi:hypothetical protein
MAVYLFYIKKMRGSWGYLGIIPSKISLVNKVLGILGSRIIFYNFFNTLETNKPK